MIWRVHLPRWAIRVNIIVLIAIYLSAIVFAYHSSLLLYGRGKSLAAPDVHRAWLTEALPWLIACGSAVVIAYSKSFRRRSRLLIAIIASGIVTVYVAISPVAYSIDITNYLWSGRLTLHGVNPYLYAPNSQHLAAFRNFRYWWMLGWKGLHAAYPPVAEIYFAVGEMISRGFIGGYKALMVLNAIVCALLMYLVLVERRRALSPQLTVGADFVSRTVAGFRLLTDADISALSLFLLFPPYLFESYGASHVDALAIPWLLLAWWFHLRGRKSLLGVAIGVAASIKVYPIVLLAAFFDIHDWKGNAKIVAGAVAISCLTAIPFLSAGLRIFSFIHQSAAIAYNGSLQYLLIKLFGPASINAFSTPLILLLELAVWAFVLFTRARLLTVEQKASLLGLTFILASPLVHPWYAVSFLPFSIVAGDVAVLSFAILSHLTYDEFPMDMYLEYVPTYALFIRLCVSPFAETSVRLRRLLSRIRS